MAVPVSAAPSMTGRKRKRETPKEATFTPLQTDPSTPNNHKLSRVAHSTDKNSKEELGRAAPPLDHEKVRIFTDFASLGVKPWLSSALASLAIHKPTRIQSSCIPEILKGKDCIGGSKTGSGKTMTFVIPVLQQWAEDPIGIYGLVLTPTRELALQTYEQFRALSAFQSLKVLIITGGGDMREQAIALGRRPHIVIATPGRLVDHIMNSGEDTICALRRVKVAVLDEADRLLAPGEGSMLEDLNACLSILPPPSERQTLLFSATISPDVEAISAQPREPGRRPLYVCQTDTTQIAIPSSLHQTYLLTTVTHREVYLHVLLQTPTNTPRSILIFTNRASTADYLAHLLSLLGHRVTSLHSRLPQRDRISNLARFRARAARILVATDVAARGLDIPEVALVLNYDVPREPADYIHRVGRTARAGRAGQSLTFVGQRDVDCVLAIEERVGEKMAEWEEEGVSLGTRVLKEVGVVRKAKHEALLEIEEGRDVGGRRGDVRKSDARRRKAG